MQSLYRDVVVWDAESESARRCDVRTEDARIVAVEPAGSFRYGPAYEGGGKTAMLPGFVNAHGHAAMTLLRGLGEDLPLMEWLEQRIWPVERRLDGEMIYTGTELAMMDMLSTGTTCFADMYDFMDKVAEAALAAGMRAGLCRGIVLAKPSDMEKKLSDGLRLAESYNGAGGLISVQLGPHAPYTVPFAQMKEIAAAAAERELGIQLHWLETRNEWSIAGTPGGLSPEEYLEASGLTDVNHLLLAHCVWIDKEKLPFYARPNITAAHNPKSNWKLGSGSAPVAAMLEAKVSVAIGTDGASSNNRLDMWDEMRFAALAQKGSNMNPTLLSARDVFRMATVAGARALGFENTGLIKEGYTADFMLVDLDRPHYVGWDMDNLPGYIVYAGSSSDVKTTVAAGRVLYHNGEFLTIDRSKAMAKAEAARKILTA
ncbi:MAG: amidohydrolase [Synergistaceae bacterium]|nr:amidohydrolase [Synergistaceae bacterium]